MHNDVKMHRISSVFLVGFHKVYFVTDTRCCVRLKALIYKGLRWLQEGYKFDTSLASL